LSRRELFAVLAGAGLSASIPARIRAASPDASGRVVTIRNPDRGEYRHALLGGMLDRSITALTGADTPAGAWTDLFSPQDHVAIKVNCLGGPHLSTDHRLVHAVVQRLRNCGVKPRRIIVWDRSSRELEEAGFTLSRGGGAVQCYGTDEVGYASTLYEHGSVASLFSRIVTDRCNKIINMPILKDHGICGMTFALKNHFGAIHNPNKFHLNRCDPYIAELNAMNLIREREVLIIGDLRRIQAEGGPSYKKHWAVAYDGVLMGTDPVAVDAVALGILEEARKGLGREDLRAKGLHPDYIETAHRMGVGDMEKREHIALTS
jgi:uncharacterized protein (DUF362 family)